MPLRDNSKLLTRYPVIIVGAGQAGLSVSHYLQQLGIEHLLIERHTPMHVWREQRWDSFTLVTPNWQCALPGHPYDGDDPHGFMKRDEINAYLRRFEAKLSAPVLTHTQVLQVDQQPCGTYRVQTSNGDFEAEQLVVATGGYHNPVIPRAAEKLPQSIQQITTDQYRNPQSLPPGAVLVVGSGQSGSQIAEDLHLAGRKVHLATGSAPRCARFYRGRDVVDWLAEMQYYDIPVDQHPLREGVRDNTNHYVTGRDNGRDIDLRQFALEGMELYGSLADCDREQLRFNPNLGANLDQADATYNSINQRIDDYIAARQISAPPASRYQPVWQPETERTAISLADAEIGSVVWCIGFQPDYRWLDVPVFSGKGYPQHQRGVTTARGLYFIGLPWLHTWGSGRFAAVARDAEYLSQQIAALQQCAGAELKSA
ncbi:MSMEG_0569 family flavin-dependent oxidoreductase [Pseudomaricurvus alcaniphilus]|uniref:MSMEG_0569 family flavin-dependent oxidoreductase n=1 Tax=Pseudomaricurvus alcaniphilus TaxID=1166482 RepID=UPI00140B8755|nr:MSMEG_0569 family flavin-dependent oxidoreductase [Pseudomaricurvus alcaniphilus]NHN39494.1 MSMEG_0569 family flavin-dependent oxidoreductase [Pseudomaricurvus alcaniphilus]